MTIANTADRTILGLAVLEVNQQHRGWSYLDNFVPLVAECVGRCCESVVTAQAVQDGLSEHFGLAIPRNVLGSILKRAGRRGYVDLDRRLQVYVPNRDKIATLKIAQRQQELAEAQDLLLDDLLRFATERHSRQIKRLEASAALIDYLQTDGLQVLAASQRGSIIPSPPPTSETVRFIVARFIIDLMETRGRSFELLDKVAKSSLMANAVFAVDGACDQRKFRRTAVYFDTVFLLQALGYQGEPRRAPCLELMAILQDCAAQLRCFQHTRDEVHNILLRAQKNLETGQRITQREMDSVEWHCRRSGIDHADVGRRRRSLETEMQALGIKVLDAPRLDTAPDIDEQELRMRVTHVMRHPTPEALDRDIKSVMAISTLRGRRQSAMLEETPALFVTTNDRLANAVNSMMESSHPQVARLLVSDLDLTTILWLKKPAAAPDLPSKRLLADCYAAMQPSDEFWSKYLAQVEKLVETGTVTEEDAALLRHEQFVLDDLMDLTLGQTRALTQATPEELWERMQRRAVDDVTKSKDEQILAERRRTDKVAADLEAERGASRKVVDRLKDEVKRRQDARSTIRHAWERRASWLVGLVALAIVGAITGLTWAVSSGGPWETKAPAWVGGVLFVYVALDQLTSFTGLDFKLPLDRLHDVVAQRAADAQLSKLGLSEEDDPMV